MNRFFAVLISALLLLCPISPVSADVLPPAPGEVVQHSSSPNAVFIIFALNGWQGFCGRNPAECPKSMRLNNKVTLTYDLAKKLRALNEDVNWRIGYRTDQEQYGVPEYWTYPVSGWGDCEDYALEKRRQMLAMGLPRSALLIATLTYVENGILVGHAVLVLRTTGGDYIFDNRFTQALTRADAERIYNFHAVQSPAGSNKWLDWSNFR